MRSIKLNIIKCLQLIVIIAALASANFVNAQDLIKDTRSGVQSTLNKKDIEPNNIAKKVQETLRHTEFMNVSAFNLSEGQQELVVKNKSQVEDAVYLTYNRKEVAKIVESNPVALKLQIPVSEDKSIQLELIRNNFTAAGFKITTSDGEEIDISDRALFYKGIVKGNPKSIAGISIFDGKISGVISDKNGNYNLGTFENKEDQLVLYNSDLSQHKSEKNCGVDELKHRVEQEYNQSNSEKSSLNKTNANTCDSDDCVGIYYEVASSFYNERGSKAAVLEYLTNVFNNAAIVFDNEDIKICISHIFIWTSGDNYVDWDEVPNSRGVQLEQKFAPNLMDYDFPGNIAFLIYHHPSGDGLAWWDGDPLICRDHTITGYGPIGVIGLKGDAQDFPNPSRDVQTFVHEKGHTFGSPHTHACEWTINGVPFQAIDGCANTEPHPVEYDPIAEEWIYATCSADPIPISEASLMSYCSGQDIPLSNGFGPLPGQLMRDNYNYALANGCLVVSNDDIFSQYPFISMYVDENNCTSEQITVYNKWSIDFLYIETPNSSGLYRGDTGQLWCAGDHCVNAYGLTSPIAHWRCCDADEEEPPTSCDNDPVLSQYPFANTYVNENSCTSEKITVYNKWNIDWLFIETPDWSRLYRGDTEQLWCAGDHCVTAYGLTNPIANWECCDGEPETEPEPEPECDNDPIFSQYPLANTYVNESSCTSEKITVYDKWSIDWLFIETPAWSRLYRGDTGQLWCTTTANYDCVAAYGLTNPIAEWECCSGQLREDETLTQEDFLIFPNPNNGIFNLMIPEGIEEDFTAEIYSIDGKQLTQIELNNNLQQSINLTRFSSGLYLIKVVSNSYNATQKFTIR